MRPGPCQRGAAKFDPKFRGGAVRIFRDTGMPIVQVARDLGMRFGDMALGSAGIAGGSVIASLLTTRSENSRIS